MVAEFDQRRKVVVDGLNKLPGVSCITPKGAFYAFPNVKRTGWKAKALASSLLEDTGVALIGGPDFGILGEGYMRALLRQLDREHPARRSTAWASSWRTARRLDQSINTTGVPFFTIPASASASQLVMRTQPCESTLPTFDGSDGAVDAVGLLG